MQINQHRIDQQAKTDKTRMLETFQKEKQPEQYSSKQKETPNTTGKEMNMTTNSTSNNPSMSSTRNKFSLNRTNENRQLPSNNPA